MKKEVEGLTTRVNEVEVHVDNTEKRVVDLEKMDGDYGKEVRKMIKSEVNEVIEREEKANNIVIRNLEEIEEREEVGDDDDEENDEDEKIKNDEDLVNHMLKNVLQVKNVVVSNVRRVGRRQDNSSRLTVVKLQTWEMKDKVLRASKVLRDNADWKKVYISPDLTREQQKRTMISDQS
eukprot:gene1261-1390_t